MDDRRRIIMTVAGTLAGVASVLVILSLMLYVG
jgi:hypothetical protein